MHAVSHCQNALSGKNVQTVDATLQKRGTTTIKLVDRKNPRSELGVVRVPPNSFSSSTTNLLIQPLPLGLVPQLKSSQFVVSTIVDLRALPGRTSGSTQLDHPIEICLKVNHIPPPPPPQSLNFQCKKEEKKSLCLAFINKKAQFECVDSHLRTNSSGGNQLKCGTTNHLTSFGVLLSSSSGTTCSSSPLFWVALSLLLYVILMFILILLAEWRLKIFKRLILGDTGMKNWEFRQQIEERKRQSKKKSEDFTPHR